MIRIKVEGDFKHSEKFFEEMQKETYVRRVLNKYGQIGVSALRDATPKDTGKTADSWSYQIVHGKNGNWSLIWSNSAVGSDGHVPIVVLLQYGHGTRNGGYVQGRDFINPAMEPVFDEIAKDIWREVKNA